MIFSKIHRQSNIPGGYFHLEEEKTKTRVAGFGHGDNIRLKDEYGNIWLGSAVRNPDNSVVYRFRNSKGKSLVGIADGEAVTLRDERGRTWKGFVG
jgi:hypothetical protein